MKNLFTLLLSTIVAFSCTKEKIVIQELDKEFSWKSHPVFEYGNGFQLNSFANDEFCFFMSHETIYSFVKEGEVHPYGNSGQIVGSYWGTENSTKLKYPISENLIITESNKGKDHIAIRPIHNPWAFDGITNSYVDINLKSIDEDYLYIPSKGRWSGIVHLLNSRNQALIFYKVVPHYLNALLVDINLQEDNRIAWASIASMKIISLANGYDQGHMFSYNVGDNFLVCPTYKHSYLITPEGQTHLVSNTCFERLYKHKSYYIAYEFGTRNGFISTDGGFSWEHKFVAPENFEKLHYSSIQDKLIGHYKSQIFEIEWTDDFSSATIKELDNYGLEGKEITSIVEFDNKVYVSTLAGVFYRETENFFTTKENDEASQAPE